MKRHPSDKPENSPAMDTDADGIPILNEVVGISAASRTRPPAEPPTLEPVDGTGANWPNLEPTLSALSEELKDQLQEQLSPTIEQATSQALKQLGNELEGRLQHLLKEQLQAQLTQMINQAVDERIASHRNKQ